MHLRKRLLYVTDFSYQAKGRQYASEDLYLTAQLQESFSLILCNPRDCLDYLHVVDLIVFRNAGPVADFPRQYQEYLERAQSEKLITFNSVDGKGDMRGKDYLLELYRNGFPVIPSVDRPEDLAGLPRGWRGRIVVKDKRGADSIGQEILEPQEAAARLQASQGAMLAQPEIQFLYEVSFYFLDGEFQYALYAPDPAARWDLQPYQASETDLLFAQRFVAWNNIARGIERVDACRTPEGALLLVEMEDLNPFLSLDRLEEPVRRRFVGNFRAALAKACGLT